MKLVRGKVLLYRINFLIGKIVCSSIASVGKGRLHIHVPADAAIWPYRLFGF